MNIASRIVGAICRIRASIAGSAVLLPKDSGFCMRQVQLFLEANFGSKEYYFELEPLHDRWV